MHTALISKPCFPIDTGLQLILEAQFRHTLNFQCVGSVVALTIAIAKASRSIEAYICGIEEISCAHCVCPSFMYPNSCPKKYSSDATCIMSRYTRNLLSRVSCNCESLQGRLLDGGQTGKCHSFPYQSPTLFLAWLFHWNAR